MDGRTHPASLKRSYYGHSIGWWDGDTLVVDTAGDNESFWIDRRGTPHTDQMRTLERFTRLDAVSVKYEVTVGDPGPLTAPWKTRLQPALGRRHRAVRVRLPAVELRAQPDDRRRGLVDRP